MVYGMIRNNTIAAIMAGMISFSACGGIAPIKPAVTAKKEKPTWISESQLAARLKNPDKKYLIFGAAWCEACAFLRRAIAEEPIINDAVDNINLDEEWAQRNAIRYNINVIPTMLVLNEHNDVIAIRTSAAQIVLYLLLNIELQATIYMEQLEVQ